MGSDLNISIGYNGVPWMKIYSTEIAWSEMGLDLHIAIGYNGTLHNVQ
jgi:hypothetical protein